MIEKQLSISERDQLKIAEDEIAQSLASISRSFFKLGEALKKIRDHKLYREECRTFEEYIQRRWGWKRQRGYELIYSYEIQKALPENERSLLQNPGQALALKVAEESERAEILRNIQKRDGKITKKTISEEINSRLTPTEVSTPVSTKPRTYGNPIDFRGLRHEPTNENGVVFLFGLVAKDLGFSVESVQAGYPDCDAKRKVGPNKWTRVRIEFEYESKNFYLHGHDPNGCDMIVCWKHNWSACPSNLEILELSTAIKSVELLRQ